MYLTRGSSVQRTLTSRPKGWPAGQIPGPASQPAFMSTQEGEGKGGGESRWRPNHMAGHHLVSYRLN
jgi:hypothetical protein